MPIQEINQNNIIIEKYSDGYCGYPHGFSNGAIVGQGKTYFEALMSTNDSIKAFIEYFGIDEFNSHFSPKLRK